jgi:hypothetical protein
MSCQRLLVMSKCLPHLWIFVQKFGREKCKGHWEILFYLTRRRQSIWSKVKSMVSHNSQNCIWMFPEKVRRSSAEGLLV